MNNNIYEITGKLIDTKIDATIFRATSTGNSTGNLEEIIRDGQTVADTQRYPTLSSCPALIAGDEVLVVKFGLGCIILGRIDS